MDGARKRADVRILIVVFLFFTIAAVGSMLTLTFDRTPSIPSSAYPRLNLNSEWR